MSAAVPTSQTTPVLIAGGGPVGLAVAIDLGRRGHRCILVEQEDGIIRHPRATALNARTLEFLRRWGIADAVREAGVPADFPHTVLYLTSLTGFEIARIERPGHGMGKSSDTSPERPQRCNQLWLDPILRDLAASYDAVTLRYRCRLETVSDRGDHVVATILNRETGERETIAAEYVVDASGGRSAIREALGIAMDGDPTLDYNVSIFLRIPELWAHHDKGKAALHHFVDGSGIAKTLIGLDGRELWRLGLRGKQFYDQHRELDIDEHVRAFVGKSIPYELLSVVRWVTHDLVAQRYRVGRIVLAGDAAHLNSPSGGFGLNTGMGDVVDVGWKLGAILEGWGSAGLLESYDLERRPIAVRNVRQATENYKLQRMRKPATSIADDTPDGARARKEWGDDVVAKETRTFITDGTALGYRYDPSPLCIPDGSPEIPDTIQHYEPNARPGARAPHAWLADGRSIIDLFGDEFVLLRFPGAPDVRPLAIAFAARGVPFHTVAIDDAAIAALYERRLVLVRPDGHVAWRSDQLPEDPAEIVEIVRGARVAAAAAAVA